MTIQDLNAIHDGFTNYVDIADGLERIRGNKKLYGMLLKHFLADTRIEPLKAQLAEGNFEEASHTAHSIKGVAANLSLSEAYKAALEMEVLCKASDETAKSVVNDFETVISKTVELLNELLLVIEQLEV